MSHNSASSQIDCKWFSLLTQELLCVSLSMFIFTGQGYITEVFDKSGSFQLSKCSTWNLICSCCILKCSCLMAEVWLKPNPNRSDIAWVSFDLQEHKSHNNAALVMDHLSLLWSNYQEYGIPYTIPILPTYVGGKREEEKLSMLPEDIGNFSP